MAVSELSKRNSMTAFSPLLSTKAYMYSILRLFFENVSMALKSDPGLSSSSTARTSVVEQVILAFPGVLSALVRARPNPFTGFVVETEVVVDGESVPQEFVPRLLEHCRAHLPPYKVPARVTPVPGLATSPAGKAERR